MTAEHPPLDRIAAYAAADLDAADALAMTGHVASCDECRAAADAIQATSRALAELLPVPPMPADVAARIDAALAAEAGAAAPVPAIPPQPQPQPQPQPVVETMHPAPASLDDARRRRFPTVAGIAAAAALVALVSAIGVSTFGPSHKKNTATTATKVIASDLAYTHGNLRTTLTRAMAAPATQRSSAPAPLAGAVEGTKSAQDSAAFATARVAALNPLRTDPGRFASCIAELVKGAPPAARSPLFVDFAQFDGKPAVLFVFPAVGLGGQIRVDRLDVQIVGPTCGSRPGVDGLIEFDRVPYPL